MASTACSNSLSLPCARSSLPSRRQLDRIGGSLAFSSPLMSKRSRASIAPLRFTILCSPRKELAVVTVDSWESLILNSEIPVLVEFFASWCGPCRMVHRVIDEVAHEYAGRLNCFVVNTDNDYQLAENYNIKAVPMVLLFKNGKKYGTIIGTMPKDFYLAVIEKVIVL